MAINDNGTRDQYVATASQTIFPYTFEIFDQADVAVEQNGTLLSIGTHYTVSGVNVDSGGNITLVTGATAGDILTIYRDMALSRVTDYQNNGDFLADEVDADFDRLWAALQQNKNGSDLSIRANIDDAIFNSTNTTLTTPALRANKALAFTSTGELDYIAGTMPVGTLRNYTTITAMIADVANISIGDISLLDERTTGNGGGAKWKAIDATTSPGNAPTGYRIVAGSSAIAFELIIENKTVSPQQWGLSVDEVTNDSAGWLDLLQSDLVEVIEGTGAIAISSVVSATLTARKKIKGELIVKWTGAATSGLITTIDCAGFDFEYDIKTDGDSLISAGWLIENSTVMTGALPTCIFSGETTNFRATAATAFNTNAYIRGSFALVDVSDGKHSNTTRAAGLAAATQTIVVDKKTVSLYPRIVKHYNNDYSGIGSDDTGAADVDTDYFACTMPDPTNFPNGDGTNGYPDIVVESYGNTYRNPIGRSEKFQCVPNTHDNKVIRDGDNGSRTMLDASVDFNMQWGVGECRNQEIYLKGSTTSAIVTGYQPVSYFQGTDYGERRGSASCSDILIYNQINSALLDNLDGLVGLQTNVTSAAKPFGLVDIKNISLIGGTTDHAVIMSYDTGGIGSVSIDNVRADFNFNPIAIQTGNVGVRLATTNIFNTNATSRVMVNDVGGASRAFTGSCFGFNYIGIDQTYEFGATAGVTPELAGASLVDQLSSQNSGGALSVQSKFMADDETYTFGVRGFTKGNHMITIVVSFGTHATIGSFACQGASAALVAKSFNSPASIVAGTGSNPDTDGLFNIWVDANGALNAKNRLGSARAVTISFLG